MPCLCLYGIPLAERLPIYLFFSEAPIFSDIAFSFSELSASLVLACLLAAFFVVGGLVNWTAPGGIRTSYIRWGYPDWFHYVTAMIEFAAAILLIVPSLRWAGVCLGMLAMGGAMATLLRDRQYTQALAPGGVFFLTAACGWLLF